MLFTWWNVDVEGEKVSHAFSSYLAHVEIQLLGRNAQHRRHEATGDIDGHNLLVGALGTDDGLADQTLLHDLRRREYFDRKVLQKKKNRCAMNPMRAFTPFGSGKEKPLSLWASPRTPIAPCRWRIPGRAPRETGSG